MRKSNPIQIGVRAIVPYQNGLLMVEHQEKDHGDFYVFPGGGVEPGESLLQAAERELLEETSIEATADRIIYFRETEYQGSFGLEVYILCKDPKGNLSLGNDPDKPDDGQVLTNVKVLTIEELQKGARWYPEELHNVLLKDLENEFPNISYLGLSKIG